MKCNQCGFENKDNAKFCTKCGTSLVELDKDPITSESNNSKYIIIALVVIIIILIAAIGFFAFNSNSSSTSADVVQNNDSQAVQEQDSSGDGETTSQSTSSESSSSSSSTHTTSSTPVKSKSWELIGSYSGSGSGSQTISVPAGQIMVKLSAYPIKNYATNHLYVTGSNGASGGVDWGSTSAVETRSDSFEYTSSTSESLTIDYYETVSWEVEFYRYQ
ncbi:zinc ribbon domain-containing protein [Methanobrevibacter sp.]|uniref:zinc ribbon domain-containing protein n=1 Tax=Methanobrevibacter sp. TaxID=66852 RepID=UPI0026DEEEBF|nr:zinc ribbon domain-containing protein [Methanobrevibacter sp.]MDO5860770.1 zinc ribbon domain-containing protein [Methanobrevibacter sp.]